MEEKISQLKLILYLFGITTYYLVYGAFCYSFKGLLGVFVGITLHLIFCLSYLIILNNKQEVNTNGKPKQLNKLRGRN